MLNFFFKFGKQKDSNHDGGEELEQPEFYYDPELEMYVSYLDRQAYTAEELHEMGYDIELDEEDEDELLESENEEEELLDEEDGEEEELSEEGGDEFEDHNPTEEEEFNPYYDRNEELEREGLVDDDSEDDKSIGEWGRDDDPYLYGDEVIPERNTNKLLKAFGVMALIVAVALAIYYFVPKIGVEEKVDSSVNLERAEEVLTLMYVNSQVDELINKNDKILEYFDEKEHPYLDIRDDDIYIVRYAEFSNNPTTLTISALVESNENEVIARYQINNEVDLPSDRLATFKFNDNGIISNFNEERVYKVIDR